MAEALEPPLPKDIDRLAQCLLRDAAERGAMLATAESCTGGLMASLLTDMPGLSHVFERGFVTYTDEAKHQMLGVPQAVLETDGAVSEACACAMAEGAIAGSRADVALAITGFTEGGPGQPAGLVHFACARRGGGPPTHRREAFGDVGRAEVRLGALRVGLAMMADELGRLAVAA